MKKLNYIAKISTLFILLFAVGTGCSDLTNNPLNDKETGESIQVLLLDNGSFFDTRFVFSFVDQETGERLSDTELEVTIDGEKKDKLVSMMGDKNESGVYTTSNGRLTLAYDPNYEISESNPIELVVFATTSEPGYYSLPAEVSYNREGSYEIIVEMVEYIDPFDGLFSAQNGESALKSAFNSNKVNAAPMPFTVMAKINNNGVEIPEFNYTSVLNDKFLNNYMFFGHKIYAVFNLDSKKTSGETFSAEFTSQNPNFDEALYDNYGAFVYYTPGNVWNPALGLGFSQELTHVYTDRNTYTYFGTTRNNIVKCADGIDITVKGNDNIKGSAKFTYQVLSGTEVLKSGKLSFSSFPHTTNTGVLYYPSDNNTVTVKIQSDAQYDLDKTEVTLSDFCDKNIEIVATPKVNLKSYTIAVNFTCPGQNIGASPSIRGEYKIKGSDDDPVEFEFVNGVTTLQLVEGETYEIKGSIEDSQEQTFDMPTNSQDASSVTAQALTEIEELQDLTFDFKETASGTQINIGVYFKPNNCPF